MKIAILSDTHFGFKGDDTRVLDHQRQFFEETFFPVITKLGIKHVVHLGDLVHKPKVITFKTLNAIQNMLLEPLLKMEINMDMIVGNHDLPDKNNSYTNSGEVLRGYTNVVVHKSVTPIILEEKYHILLCPWIHDGNREKSMYNIFEFYLKDTNRPPGKNILMGHFDIDGFVPLDSKIQCLRLSQLKDYDIVLSGHYHNKANKKNVFYVGSPWPVRWGEDTVAKGFHIFDLETLQLDFYENENPLFVKLVYNERRPMEVPKNVKDKFIKLKVEHNENAALFNSYLTKLEEVALDVKIDNPNSYIVNLTSEKIQIGETKDTVEIIKDTLDELEFKSNDQDLKKYFMKLYREAEMEVEIE